MPPVRTKPTIKPKPRIAPEPKPNHFPPERWCPTQTKRIFE